MKSSVPVDIQRFLIVFFVVVVWAKKYCALLIVFVVRESHVDKPNTNTHTHVQHKQTSIYVYIVTYSKAVFKPQNSCDALYILEKGHGAKATT